MAWRLRHQLTKSSNLSVQRLPGMISIHQTNFGDTTGTTGTSPIYPSHHAIFTCRKLTALWVHWIPTPCATGAMRNAKRVLWQVGPWRLNLQFGDEIGIGISYFNVFQNMDRTV